MYPSIEELVPEHAWWMLPARLVIDLQRRYEEHGPEYLTDELFEGRRINACMNKNSATDVVEELTDAIFNVCVLVFKQSYDQQLLAQLVLQCVEAWKLAKQIEEAINEDAVV